MVIVRWRRNGNRNLYREITRVSQWRINSKDRFVDKYTICARFELNIEFCIGVSVFHFFSMLYQWKTTFPFLERERKREREMENAAFVVRICLWFYVHWYRGQGGGGRSRAAWYVLLSSQSSSYENMKYILAHFAIHLLPRPTDKARAWSDKILCSRLSVTALTFVVLSMLSIMVTKIGTKSVFWEFKISFTSRFDIRTISMRGDVDLSSLNGRFQFDWKSFCSMFRKSSYIPCNFW